jgi:hypothetical protein
MLARRAVFAVRPDPFADPRQRGVDHRVPALTPRLPPRVRARVRLQGLELGLKQLRAGLCLGSTTGPRDPFGSTGSAAASRFDVAIARIRDLPAHPASALPPLARTRVRLQRIELRRVHDPLGHRRVQSLPVHDQRRYRPPRQHGVRTIAVAPNSCTVTTGTWVAAYSTWSSATRRKTATAALSGRSIGRGCPVFPTHVRRVLRVRPSDRARCQHRVDPAPLGGPVGEVLVDVAQQGYDAPRSGARRSSR